MSKPTHVAFKKAQYKKMVDLVKWRAAIPKWFVINSQWLDEEIEDVVIRNTKFYHDDFELSGVCKFVKGKLMAELFYMNSLRSLWVPVVVK